MSHSTDEKRRRAAAIAASSLKTITAEEDAAITAAAMNDIDNPPLSDVRLAAMRPTQEVAPEFAEVVRRHRGPQKAPKKALVSLRLDADVLTFFKAQGAGWQTRINDVLRNEMSAKFETNAMRALSALERALTMPIENTVAHELVDGQGLTKRQVLLELAKDFENLGIEVRIVEDDEQKKRA